MTNQRDADLALYALDLLDGEDLGTLERELEHAPEARAALRETERALAALAITAAPSSPRPSLRDDLLTSLEGPKRLEHYVRRLADLFDLGLDETRAHVERLDDEAAPWEESPIRGVSLYHLTGGPRIAEADAGFVRQTPGTEFPYHVHTGNECALVLEGRARCDTGELWLPGDLLFAPGGSGHSFRALDEPLLYAVVLAGALDFRSSA
jgi:quercetin dioxygenase-like cupin family protein